MKERLENLCNIRSLIAAAPDIPKVATDIVKRRRQ